MIAIILGLFRACTVFGLTPLYIVSAAFSSWRPSSVSASVAPGICGVSGFVRAVRDSLVAVLLVYLKEDAIEARKLVYGLVLANAAVSGMSLIVGWHISMPGAVRRSFSRRSSERAHGSLVGTSCCSSTCWASSWPTSSSATRAQPVSDASILSLLVIVTFDNFVFVLITQGISRTWATKSVRASSARQRQPFLHGGVLGISALRRTAHLDGRHG